MKRFLAIALLTSALGLHAQSPAVSVPDVLKGEVWKTHMEQDLLPFWTTPDALGTPVGNFPTYRDMKGRPAGNSWRFPRMMGRQIFVYCAGYLVTGRTELLEYARAGVRWLIDHAWDKQNGGWVAELDQNGKVLFPRNPPDKAAQDTAYAAMGLAGYFFVTRDPEAEEYLLKTEALIFDPKYYWDAEHKRVRDALNYAMTEERDQAGGGWELVALLDQLNAYMLLVQPVLTKPEDRAKWAADSLMLAQSIKDNFYQAPIFWGQQGLVGQGGIHVDFGHNFKSHWMLYLLDKHLGTNQFTDFVLSTVTSQIPKAMDPATGLWGSGSRDFVNITWGSSWWIYAELDQITATLNLIDGRYTGILAQTAAGWLTYFVDKENHEVFPNIDAQGQHPAYNEYDTAKVGDWKNGFHSMEHALVMYIHGLTLEGKPIPLYFAQRVGAKDFAATAYLFPSQELSRTAGKVFKLGDADFTSLRIEFKLKR